MKLKEILAISGQPGLFKYVARSANGVIVESLADGHRTNASGTAKISSLAEIELFTEGDDVPLATLFENLYKINEGGKSINPKSDAAELRRAFGEALPQYDRERVHTSDMKKAIAWYNNLIENGMTDFSLEEEEEPAEPTAAEPEAEKAE